MLAADGISHGPLDFEYAVRYEGHTELSASAFQELTDSQTPSEALGLKLHSKEVIEIDDGIVPYHFYLVESFIARSIFFDGEKARKNQLESKPEKSEM
jgi:hypothetical protein